jgi:hypothetical protein
VGHKARDIGVKGLERPHLDDGVDRLVIARLIIGEYDVFWPLADTIGSPFLPSVTQDH